MSETQTEIDLAGLMLDAHDKILRAFEISFRALKNIKRHAENEMMESALHCANQALSEIEALGKKS